MRPRHLQPSPVPPVGCAYATVRIAPNIWARARWRAERDFRTIQDVAYLAVQDKLPALAGAPVQPRWSDGPVNDTDMVCHLVRLRLLPQTWATIERLARMGYAPHTPLRPSASAIGAVVNECMRLYLGMAEEPAPVAIDAPPRVAWRRRRHHPLKPDGVRAGVTIMVPMPLPMHDMVVAAEPRGVSAFVRHAVDAHLLRVARATDIKALVPVKGKALHATPVRITNDMHAALLAASTESGTSMTHLVRVCCAVALALRRKSAG